MAELRSPNYPRKSLPLAIRDAQLLYDKEKTATCVGTVAAKAFGYPKLHGKVQLRLAAMKQYGLLDVDKKAGTFRLSQRALAILLRPETHPDRQTAIDAAALEPELFKEFWKHQPTASDDSLNYDLIANKGFSENGAAAFLKAYRETIQMLSESKETALTDEAIRDTVDDQQAENRGPELADDEQRPEDFQVGDYVQWTNQGVDQFKTPRQIIGFYDKDHAKVTGTKTGVPVRELSKWEQSARPNTGSSSQQLPESSSGSPIMETAQHPEPQRMEQYSVPIGGEAYVVITMPAKMTQEQYGRLKGYIDLFERSHCELP